MATESAAILFTDIVGSTELTQRLSPELADDVRRGHFSILRQALAETGGTEVKNLGDGLMVVFGSASAALGCAVAMQQGVEQDNRGNDHSVGLRVGLSGGEVSLEDDDYFGDPVIEAARLCAACESGQIMAAEVVRLMAGRRSRHSCRPVGGLALKGLLDPVHAVEVLWAPLEGSDSEAIPLPGRLVVRPNVGVVGREAELSQLADAAKQVAAGEGRQVLLVSGEAGQGKTTLVAEVARIAFDRGAFVLFGHCEEDLATPYQLFAEALGHYVAHAPEDQILAHVEAHGSELARMVPALFSRIPDLPPSKATDSDTERHLLFAAVIGLLATMSDHQLVVLALDDLQWADKGSLLLLHHLAAGTQAMRMLVLGTYRDSEVSQSHPLLDALAALHRQGGVSRIDLAGLDDTGVVALMEATAGYSLDDAAVGLAHAVYRETDGNPFFVSEVMRHLSETGAVYRDATGRWTAQESLDQMALPISVREVIGARVGRLGHDAGRVLSVASVIGQDFDIDLLARATEITEDDLLDILDAATAASLVRELTDTAGRFNFAHALVQRTIYEDMGPNRQAGVHRQVAEALEHLCGDRPGARVGELARHWSSATQPNLAKALDYSRQAGDAALNSLAPADALRYYAHALDLFAQAADPDAVLGLDLAIGLGTAQRQTGDPAFRDTLLAAARQAADLGDGGRLAAAALANDRGMVSSIGSLDAEKVEILEMALDRLPAEHPDRPLVLATLCAELHWGSPLERRQSLAEEALDIAESSGDDATMVRVLNHVFTPLFVPALLEQSLARTADALVRAERLGDPTLLFWAADWRDVVSARAGDMEEMDRSIGIAKSIAEQLDLPILKWGITLDRAMRALIAGNTDQAEQLATDAFQLGIDSGQPDADVLFGGQLMMVNFQRGSVGDLIPLIEEWAAETNGIASGVMAGILAAAHAEGDRVEDACRLLAEFADVDFDLPLDPLWLTGMVCYADASIDCQAPQYAGPLFERLVPWAGQLSTTGGVTAEGPVSHFLGGLAAVLGRFDDANTFFAQAAAMNERMDAKFFAARTDLLWGKMFVERQAPGDPERAQDLLTRAQIAAAAHGYGTVERRATAALRGMD